MKYYFLLSLIGTPFFSIAQYTIQGKVVNGKTGKGIPYATIGFIKRNTGMNAGKDGSFTFTTTKNLQGDTFSISSTGYKPLLLTVDSFANGIIELIEDTTLLADVIVTNAGRKNWKTAKLNDFSNGIGGGLGSDGSQTEVAVYLQLPGEDAYLKEIKISQGGMGAFGADKTLFRVKIYGFDILTKGPANELYSQLVEVESDKLAVTTKIDLEAQQIYLLQKDFFVAVEWLKIPENEIRVTGTTAEGTERGILWYRPNLNGTRSTTNLPEIWFKNYKGIWRKQWDAGVKSLAIAATVKY